MDRQEKLEKDQKQQQDKKPTGQQQKVENKVAKDQEQDKQDAENTDGRKDPETYSQGQRMGLSKQQLKKLKKRLQVQAKKKKKQQQAAQKQAQKTEHNQKKQKGKKNPNQVQWTPEQFKTFNQQKITVHPNKKSPAQGKKNILITSALPYVNNVPHLGNIIGCVLSADVYARFKRLQGDNVLYICGTDQYGTATEVKALQQNKTPKQVCDFYHSIHKNVYDWFDIGFDYFGRTSTQWHTKICQEIFLNIQKNGRILKQKMQQCYCQKCDLFLADRFVGGTCPHPQCGYTDARGDQCDKCQKLFNSPIQMKDIYCTICKNKPIQKQTQHFFVDLPEIQPELQKWITHSSVQGKWSQNSIAMTKGWTNLGLKPKCITRDLKWGVPVPLQQYKKKVFYVWFDAPIGYISITANLLGQQYVNWWRNPENVSLYQFMGKDNVPFHTVIFPSSLIAANKDWTLLHHISTTQYLNYQSGKFSKRNGTGVFGDSASETGIPAQAWRYYLLVNRPEKSDSQFSWSDFVQKNNSQLLANLGNLCNRALKFCYKQYQKQIPKFTFDNLSQQDRQFLKLVQQKYLRYVELLNSVQIKQGLKAAMQISSIGNKYLQDSKFWEQQNKKSGRTNIITGVICNFIRLVSLIFQPYIPSTSAKINYLLGIQRSERDEVLGQIINEAGLINIFNSLTEQSKGLRQPIPLFKQYTPEEAENWRNKFKGQNQQ